MAFAILAQDLWDQVPSKFSLPSFAPLTFSVTHGFPWFYFWTPFNPHHTPPIKSGNLKAFRLPSTLNATLRATQRKKELRAILLVVVVGLGQEQGSHTEPELQQSCRACRSRFFTSHAASFLGFFSMRNMLRFLDE